MNKLLAGSILFLSVLFSSCRDDFFELNPPSWLGESIYNQLEEGVTGANGTRYTFKYYIQLINDLGYADVLKQTGSKTVFVADDAAFERFLSTNDWGVKTYDQLSEAQKKVIFNSAMLNNALLIENLSKIEGPVDGQALRRATAMAVQDTIAFEKGTDLPATSYWNRFRTNGLKLAKDDTPVAMTLFLEAQMKAHSISVDDFKVLFNGEQWQKGDAYVFNIKVVERDIICQNGYIHVLKDVLIPPSNIAEELRINSETQLFSSFIERFAAPYYSELLTRQSGSEDSVFVKGYFSERSSVVTFNSTTKDCLDPQGRKVTHYLLYDPGWNRYRSNPNTGSYQTDMAVMFAPTNQALNTYFQSGAGRTLLDRYCGGSIENIQNIPTDLLADLIRNHMKLSFLGSIPSLFHTIVDDAQERMGLHASDVAKVVQASNGIIYIMNKVYPPALYSSVMFPARINDNMKVFYWAIKQLEFDAYLLSMVNYYSFVVPEDNFTYIVPTSLKHDQPVAWRFKYDNQRNSVYASVHPYTVETGEVGDSIATINTLNVLKNHLEDMLDAHIIVGNIEEGREYYRTKGGATIRVRKRGNQLQLAAGGDIQRGVNVGVERIYDQSKETNGQGNGKAYIVRQPVQTAVQSVYSILSTTPEFRKFFTLLQGYDDLWEGDPVRSVKYSIFYKDVSKAGLDMNVRFLNTFHYTLYVPVNEEVQRAIDSGKIPTWDDVEAETDQEERDKKAEKIIRFLRYHFQDNAVFVDKPAVSASFETATLNQQTETFYKLYLSGGGNSLTVKDVKGNEARVLTQGGLYNIMARDFKFNTSSPSNASMIETSSHVVIHQIDKCLNFE
ncbi:MAG: hypothetical protein BGP01_00770 [Paludibacter sp. 47-17]|nr:MAG: hypothetical protein BGP01_00770 [Paludibacter sp. 47-17]